jgi:hypothetical protein
MQFNPPVILTALDPRQRISTRWLSEHTGRRLALITEAVLQIEDGRDFDHQRDSRGYVVNSWIPLTDALILLSQFEGQKAQKARNLIREAVDYYLTQRPILEAEIAQLRAQSFQPAPKLSGRKKGMIPVPIEQASLFGDRPVVHYVMMPTEGVSETARTKGQIRHMQRQMAGMAKKINELQDRLDGVF